MTSSKAPCSQDFPSEFADQHHEQLQQAIAHNEVCIESDDFYQNAAVAPTQVVPKMLAVVLNFRLF